MRALQGDFEGAVRDFESAAKLNPTDAAIRLNLAVAYAQLGRTADARSQAHEALRLNPEYAKARELLAVLEK